MTMSKKTILVLLFIWTTIGAKANDVTDCIMAIEEWERVEEKRFNDDYINRYKYIAISEMERTGIPASIKLGQALLESGAGKSTLAREANNHFGIKCGSKWKGKKHYRKDDDYVNGKLIKSCFRVYRNAEDSYYAHSAFLMDNKRYKDLFKISSSNYKRWARGLKKAGYATSKTYDDKLIKLIEAYDLYRFDQMASSDMTARPNMRRKKSELFYINDAKALFAKSGDTPRKIAERTGRSLKRILKYNEELQFPSQIVKEEEKVFVQRKRRNFRGKKRTHDVEEGETMYDIAQEYGLRLDKLYKKNKMKAGTQPAVGEPIQIRGKAKKQPKLRNSTPIVKPPPVIVPPPIIVTEEPTRTESWEEEPIFETSVFEESEESPFIEFEEEEEEEFEEPIFEESPIYNPQTTGTSGNTTTYPETTTVPIYEPEKETTTESEVIIPPYISVPVERTQQYHTVQKGETLWRISQNYDTTVDAIKRMNNLQSNIISVGMQLRVK